MLRRDYWHSLHDIIRVNVFEGRDARKVRRVVFSLGVSTFMKSTSVSPTRHTRPSSEAVKESLFFWTPLGHDLPKARLVERHLAVIDLPHALVCSCRCKHDPVPEVRKARPVTS